MKGNPVDFNNKRMLSYVMLSDAVSLWFSHLLLEFGEVNPGGPTMDNQPLLSILPVRAAQPSVVSGQHEAGGCSQAPSCRTASASQCFVCVAWTGERGLKLKWPFIVLR